MKTLTVSLALLVFLANQSYGRTATDSLKLDSLMNFYFQEYNFNGVAFVAKQNNIFLNKGYGYMSFAQKRENTGSGIFQIGSNTKQFTAEVIVQLASKKIIGLQDALSKYFPDFPDGNRITIENLLTHTSGIHNYTEDSIMQVTPTEPVSEKVLMAHMTGKPLEFAPGSKFKYSNSNYVLLGYIIEKVCKAKYEDVVRKYILQPSGMTHSGFDFKNLSDSNKVTGYMSVTRDSAFVAPIADSTVSFAAGALYSCVSDLYKWHKALRNNSLLDNDWQQKVFEPNKYGYGYGWFVDTLYGIKIVGHPGGIHGFYSYFMRSDKEDLCIILIQNIMHPRMDNNTIAINILKCLFDPQYALPRKKDFVVLGNEKLEKFAGTYSITPSFNLVVKVADSQLYVQATGQSDFKLKAKSETLFVLEEAHAELEFIKNADGNIAKLILHQNGQNIPAVKAQ